MAATNDQITALEAALFSGELRVRINDRETTYRSVEELRSALAEARASQQVAGSIRKRIVRLYSGSGL